jgi:hypothetical protein
LLTKEGGVLEKRWRKALEEGRLWQFDVVEWFECDGFNKQLWIVESVVQDIVLEVLKKTIKNK